MTKLFDSLYEVQKLNAELELGYHRSVILNISDEVKKDSYGREYFTMQLKQLDTECFTAPDNPGEIDYKNIIRIRKGEAGVNGYGYPVQAGYLWKKFFREEVFVQFPDLDGMNWADALEEMHKRPVDVWYTRYKGYLQIHLTEEAYRKALKSGCEGGPDPITETKELNEDCPF